MRNYKQETFSEKISKAKIEKAPKFVPALLGLADLYPGRTGVTTEQAAAVLGRKPQTLRKWATYQTGPIQPIRIGSRLQWRLSDLQRLVG